MTRPGQQSKVPGPVVLGVDIGGSKTALGIVDPQGQCLARRVLATQSQLPAGAFFRSLAAEAQALLASLGDGASLVGVGIGAPNANYYTASIVHPPNLGWAFVDLRAELAPYFPVPLAATNDANAVALGEGLFGAARGMRDFLVITLGTGVGSGIVANGELIHGANGMAAELGHTTVLAQGRECGCGRLGCLETYASASGICRTLVELLANRRQPSLLRNLAFAELSSLRICELARQGDALALEAFAITGRILGAKLAEAVLHTDPEAIILFGGVARAGELLLSPIRQTLEEHLPLIFKGKVAVLPSGLAGADAAIQGAGALIWSELKQKQRGAGAARVPL